MSSPTPAQRATAAQRLDFHMLDLELGVTRAGSEGVELPTYITAAIERLRTHVDHAEDVLTRA